MTHFKNFMPIAAFVGTVVILALWFLLSKAVGRENFSPWSTTTEEGVQAAISGGTLVDVRKYPWYTYIKSKSNSCGGVLVAPRVVLTAHHCEPKVGNSVHIGYKDPSPAELSKAGNNMAVFMTKNKIFGQDPSKWTPRQLQLMKDFRDSSMSKFGDIRMIERVINHPKRDISIIILDKASTKPPIRIAPKLPPTNSQVTAIGRGLDRPYNPAKGIPTPGDLPLAMLTVRVVTVNRAVELGRLFDPSLHSKKDIQKHKMQLAKMSGTIYVESKRNQSVCNGDSGGPLFVTKNGIHELIGIASTGTQGCGWQEEGTIASYGDVTDQTSWLAKHTVV